MFQTAYPFSGMQTDGDHITHASLENLELREIAGVPIFKSLLL